jgi:hypothetical protein
MAIFKEIFQTDEKVNYQVRLKRSAPWKSVQLLKGVILTRHWHPITEDELYQMYKPVEKFIEFELTPGVNEVSLLELPKEDITIINMKTKKLDLIRMCIEKDLGISTILMTKTKAELIWLLGIGDL